ncbi:MAG: cob(I)yrinic acid a,c-diamide adenosyltransferase [Bacillota bacterium]|jgi:cob(I)alamin adenosyltransferase|nr:cob(I)yrinic acid a,c-diamide adenosyltransferase [Bacillota bacterium]HHT90439.1 cob(I)yrinic acid a,c-diamide adenosyltransferase [Bacillota bacterium]
MVVYTRKGDQGFTTLGTGQAVPKHDQRVDAYGTIDELSSFVGLALAYLPEDGLAHHLLWVQRKLFAIGAVLAFPGQSKGRAEVTPDDVAVLEEAIDEVSAKLPSLKSFILPGGSKAAALIHVARSVCRRAERLVSALDHEGLEENILPFLNRLSDYLFCAARFVNHREGQSEDLVGSS